MDWAVNYCCKNWSTRQPTVLLFNKLVQMKNVNTFCLTLWLHCFCAWCKCHDDLLLSTNEFSDAPDSNYLEYITDNVPFKDCPCTCCLICCDRNQRSVIKCIEKMSYVSWCLLYCNKTVALYLYYFANSAYLKKL